MSNITEQIEKLAGIMSKLGEAHNMLAKTSLSKEEYQPISTLLASAKVELFNFYQKRKAAIQNKVSDISVGEILRKHLKPLYNHEGDLNDFIEERGEELIAAMEEYASIVNERKDNAGSWVSVEDRLPDVKKDGNKVLLFREMNESQKALSICVHDTSMIKYCEKSSYWMPLPAPPESQPQQKEESEKELEERTDRNMNVISDFCEHVKNEAGLLIPESTVLSFFNA